MAVLGQIRTAIRWAAGVRWGTLVVLSTWMFHLLARGAPGVQETEVQVKAAFVLNFARFVEWPAETVVPTNRPLVIGILGKDPFGKIMDDTVAGKTVDQRSISLRRGTSLREVEPCDVLFVAGSERDRLGGIIQRVKSKPLLTVSDIDGFIDKGGVIGLKRRQDTIRFDINLQAAESARLKVSSKLLKLADNLSGKP